MPINVVEIHHHGIRIEGDAAGLAANLDFYQGLLGLTPDRGRPDFPGILGFWMNVGETGQIHLFGGELKARIKTRPHRISRWRWPTSSSPKPSSIVAERLIGLLTGVAGPQALQLFVRDPYGNMIELHQVDQCRCRAVNRRSR
jgi:catechol 2,3-dioxygenase-like lactoylglutathione lyase family enzyme